MLEISPVKRINYLLSKSYLDYHKTKCPCHEHDKINKHIPFFFSYIARGMSIYVNHARTHS